MNDYISYCEDFLAKQFNRKYAILFGRGATALWSVYSTLSQKSIIIPASICLSPWAVAVLSGLKVFFADVKLSDATIDPLSLQRIIKNNPGKIGAVLAVHLFGNPAEIDNLKKLCYHNNIMVIEDVAQAFGGKDEKGRMLGSNGDVSIFSFGHSKIFDAGGGGALLTDDPILSEKVRHWQNHIQTVSEERINSLSKLYSSLYYTLWNNSRLIPEVYEIYRYFPYLFSDLYIRKASSSIARKIISAIEDFENEIERRLQLSQKYTEYLSPIEDISILSTSKIGAPWRFSFLVDEMLRDSLLEKIREKGFDASSWYPPVAAWSQKDSLNNKEISVAESISKRIINLWLTPEYESQHQQLMDIIICNCRVFKRGYHKMR